MAEKVLFVDDEQNLLDGFKRQFRNKLDFETAVSAKEALERLRKSNEFAVVVSDMRMPEMGGVEFLSQVREVSPLSVRIMLTGNADQETAVKAVNESGIFRFLLKPCSSEELLKAISDAQEQHRLLIAEKELLELTVVGSVNLLSELIAQTNPDAAVEGLEIKKIIQLLADASRLPSIWEIEVAAKLADIGCMTLPTDVAKRVRQGKPSDGNEEMFLKALPGLSAELLRNIPRFGSVAEIIERSNEPFSSMVPIGARILKLATDFVRASRTTGDPKRAYDLLNASRINYDPLLLFALFETLEQKNESSETEFLGFEIGVDQLIAGQCLLANIETIDGRLLLLKGRVLSELQVSRVKNHERLIGIKKPILVDCMVPTT
jgi:response regulator RpfG family c-di-GMP phosphodiesterase